MEWKLRPENANLLTHDEQPFGAGQNKKVRADRATQAKDRRIYAQMGVVPRPQTWSGGRLHQGSGADQISQQVPEADQSSLSDKESQSTVSIKGQGCEDLRAEEMDGDQVACVVQSQESGALPIPHQAVNLVDRKKNESQVSHNSPKIVIVLCLRSFPW